MSLARLRDILLLEGEPAETGSSASYLQVYFSTATNRQLLPNHTLPQSASEFLIGFQADCPFKLRTPQAAFKASSTLSCDSELLQSKERQRLSLSNCHTEVQGPKYSSSIYGP